MKNTKTFLIIAALVFVGLLLFRQFYVLPDRAAEELPVTAANNQLATNNQTTSNVSPAVKENQAPIKNAQELFQTSESVLSYQESADLTNTEDTPETQTFMDYEDDWCFLGQLSEADQERADEEIMVWRAKTGQNMEYWNSKERRFLSHPDDPRLPYIDLSQKELLRHVDNEEPGAMLAAMDNHDISYDQKDDIAKQLLVLGYTGTAMSHLIIKELVNAETHYKEHGLSEKVKRHIGTAMMYATYSLNRHDADGIELIVTRSHGMNIFEVELNPTLIFIDEDFEKITSQAEVLKNRIAGLRNEKGLLPLTQNLTRAAQHQMNSSVGSMYGRDSASTEILALRYEHLFPQLASNECRELQAQLVSGF